MTPNLVAQILEKERADDAANADMDIGGFAFAGDEFDLAEFQPLENSSEVFLITRQTIKAFGDHGIKTAPLRGLHQRQQPVALEHAGAGFCPVIKNLNDLVAFA